MILLIYHSVDKLLSSFVFWHVFFFSTECFFSISCILLFPLSQLLPGASCLPNNPTSCVLIPPKKISKQTNNMAKNEKQTKTTMKTRKKGKLKWPSSHKKWSSFWASHPLLAMGTSLNLAETASNRPLEKTGFTFPSGIKCKYLLG